MSKYRNIYRQCGGVVYKRHVLPNRGKGNTSECQPFSCGNVAFNAPLLFVWPADRRAGWYATRVQIKSSCVKAVANGLSDQVKRRRIINSTEAMRRDIPNASQQHRQTVWRRKSSLQSNLTYAQLTFKEVLSSSTHQRGDVYSAHHETKLCSKMNEGAPQITRRPPIHQSFHAELELASLRYESWRLTG